MKLLTMLAAGAVGLVVLGFAGYHGYLYSLGIYATDPVYQTSRGALDGYDPVAFFNGGAPAAGRADLTHEWNGATWRFATEENREAFERSPESYAPQFGGYCAYAVANGYTAKTLPEAWHIENGKLYLNFNPAVRERWLAKRADFIASAGRNWPAVLQD